MFFVFPRNVLVFWFYLGKIWCFRKKQNFLRKFWFLLKKQNFPWYCFTEKTPRDFFSVKTKFDLGNTKKTNVVPRKNKKILFKFQIQVSLIFFGYFVFWFS